MKLKAEYKKEALKISKRLEHLIYSNNTNLKELASFIGVNTTNFSRIRRGAIRGEMPTLKFLIGISKYYNENFFEFILN